MAYRVIWSPEASEDLEAIIEYIARDSHYYAKSVARKIVKIAKELRQFPLSGRMVPEIHYENIREKLIYSYRLIYRVKDNMVTISAVIHGKRLLGPFVERIKETKVLN